MKHRFEEFTTRARSKLPRSVAGAAEAIRVDLTWLHGAWMDLAFARGERAQYSVVERWEPETTHEVAGYRLWAALGAVALLLVGYPLFVVGLATRYYARKLDRFTAGLGFVGVALVSLFVWGVFSVATYLSPIAFEGFVVVCVAAVVATASAVLALYFTRQGDRRTTVALGYPFAVTALFLPPVVASLYSPSLASVVFPHSESLAIWLLDEVLDLFGLATFIRGTFDLQGLAYVGMWFGLAVPTGWLLGGLVTLVNTVRNEGSVSGVDPTESSLYR